MSKVKEKIVNEYSLNLKKGDLAKEVEELSGVNLFGCYQCGTCSAGCPYVEEMDLKVLNSKTIWLCSSCFTCAERCPRDINITKIMEALRQIILRKNIDKTKLTMLTKEEKEVIPQLAFVCLFRKNVG
ncbi:hypothetical protein AYK20_05835 [Thermoplasmatales archaeon SG8-52-1]|nr:MAG: hypothetical protein AYK20_05835 [Thermoplasmatales archaeon SG8-52-1]